MKRLVPLLLLLLALPASASAVVPGVNGDIAFTVGADAPPNPPLDDDNAKIWLYKFPGLTQLTQGTTRHSHPAFSPDGMKVAYSRSFSGAGPRDIMVRDLLTGNEINLTNSPLDDDDRAQWSPDGTEIAYGSDLDSVSGTQRDIFIRPATGGAVRNLAVSSIVSEDRPIWSPDGQYIFYARAFTATPGDSDIVKELADNTSPNPIGVVTTTDNDYQPAVSPNGQRLCFSRGGMSDGGANDVDVMIGDSTGANIVGFDATDSTGEFNCAWSPDGTKIAYVRGVFSNGALVMRNADGSGLTPLANTDQHFDGNPDWGVDPLPSCENVTATVAVNGFVSIPLACSDPLDGPIEPDIATQPAHGNLGGISDGRVIYTPAANFKGTDSFTFTGDDGPSTATGKATITVGTQGGGGTADKVKPKVSRLKVGRKRWRRGTKLPKLSAAKAKVGTTFTFTLSEAARTTFTFALKSKGRRVGRKCRKQTAKNRTKRRCNRFVKKGKLTVSAKKGTNKLRFQGRVSRRKRLGLGSYRVTVTARDKAGNRSGKRTGTFRIVKG